MKFNQIVLIATTLLACTDARDIILKCYKKGSVPQGALSSGSFVVPASSLVTPAKNAAPIAADRVTEEKTPVTGKVAYSPSFDKTSGAAAAEDNHREILPEAPEAETIENPSTSADSVAPEAPQGTEAVPAPQPTEVDEAPQPTEVAKAPLAQKPSSPVGAAPDSVPGKAGSGDFRPIPGGKKGTGKTTRYWDCCKPSCAWPGKGPLIGQLRTVNKAGDLVTSNMEKSGCEGGESFADPRQIGRVVNEQLAYGFAAARLEGKEESNYCGKCFKLTFTNTAVKGKSMVVQITNTGYDLGPDQFDLAMPGGGEGIFQGCAKQYGSFQGGQRHGGVSEQQECNGLPGPMKKGCHFRFEWFMNADNPEITYEEVTCPQEILDISGMSRQY